MTATKEKLEVIVPIGLRVLVRKDEDKKITKGGIHLPDAVEIPTLTGRIVAISERVDNDIDYPLKEYDKVIVNPARAIPTNLENDNMLFIVPVEDIIAVIRREEKEEKKK